MFLNTIPEENDFLDTADNQLSTRRQVMLSPAEKVGHFFLLLACRGFSYEGTRRQCWDFNRHSICYGMSFFLPINRNARSYCGGKTGYLIKVQARKLAHMLYHWATRPCNCRSFLVRVSPNSAMSWWSCKVPKHLVTLSIGSALIGRPEKKPFEIGIDWDGRQNPH